MKKKLLGILMIAVLMALILPGMLSAEGEDELKITYETGATVVSYPQGAEFHVEVNHPELVESYQWTMSDGVNVFVLDGETANTDTLIVPSTQKGDVPVWYCCTITDKNGHKIFTDDICLTVDNPDEFKKVLYVGDYAVEPGGKLDLEEIKVGKGTVTYDDDEINIYFDNVYISNEHMMWDQALGPALNIFFRAYDPETLEYYLHFQGDCVLENNYFDPSRNSGGVCLNSHFGVADDPNKPTMHLVGDSLTIKGGNYSIYSDAEVEIDLDLKTYPLEDKYNDGIRAHSILVDNGATLEIHSCGCGLVALGDIRFFEGTKIIIDAYMPHISVGPTSKSLIRVAGSLYGKGCEITIKGHATPGNFIPYGRFISGMAGVEYNGRLYLEDSKMEIVMDMEKAEKEYAINFGGIVSDGSIGIELAGGSSIDITVDIPDLVTAYGILSDGQMMLEEGSSINVFVRACERVRGVIVDQKMTVEDSDIKVDIQSMNGGETKGIVAGALDIVLSDSSHVISSITHGGEAFIVMSEEIDEEQKGYEEGYVSELIDLGEDLQFTVPEGAVANRYVYDYYGRFLKSEAIYDPNDTSKAAEEVLITVKGYEPGTDPEPEPQPGPAPSPEPSPEPAPDDKTAKEEKAIASFTVGFWITMLGMALIAAGILLFKRIKGKKA